LIGPFPHPVDYGVTVGLLAIGAYAWWREVDRSPRVLALFLLASSAALLSFRRKTLTGVLVAIGYINYRAARASTVLVLLFLVPLSGALLYQTIASVVDYTLVEYSNADEAPRIVLMRGSWTLALQHFPLGAGFSRFGTAIARDHYSPDYVALGFHYVWGLDPKPDGGQFLVDTMWPAVWGETGFAGAAAFLLGLVAMFRFLQRSYRSASTNTSRWLCVTGIGWFIECFFESIASPVYTAPPSFGLLFGIVGIAVGAMHLPAAQVLVEDSLPRQKVFLNALRTYRSQASTRAEL
jgi:hypothetical protein